MKDSNEITTIREYLKKNDWDEVNYYLFINDSLNSYIKFSDELQFTYYKNNVPDKYVPLDIQIHALELFSKLADYQKTIRLIRLLNDRGFQLLYENGTFTWAKAEGYYNYSSTNLNLIRALNTDFEIGLDVEGYLHIYYKDGSDGLYDGDDIIKSILIELALQINSNFYYDINKQRLDLDPQKKSEIYKSNKNYFDNY